MTSSSKRLLSGPRILTGNTAKVKLLCELEGRLRRTEQLLCILDIGTVGLQPLQFWEPLFGISDKFELVGIDVVGIDRAEALAQERGWRQVRMLQGSGYELEQLFPPESFDVVVATQVLEHVARLPLFMQQVARVLKRGGECFFTIDSAHWRPRFSLRFPSRFAKNVVKKGLSLVGYEQHYDLPWFDDEITAAMQAAGLRVDCCRYYNLAPMKFIHNHVVMLERKNAFMRLWLDLEEFLNDEVGCEKLKRFFMGLYVCGRKGCEPGGRHVGSTMWDGL